LDSRDGGSFVDEEGGKGVCCCDAEGEDLPFKVLVSVKSESEGKTYPIANTNQKSIVNRYAYQAVFLLSKA